MNKYLATAEDNHKWFLLDPEMFPYMDKNLTPEREKELDDILRDKGEDI